jgi:hypothetical protein
MTRGLMTRGRSVLSLLLDAGAAVDVWGNDLTGPLDLLEERQAQIHKDQQAYRHQQASLDAEMAAPKLGRRFSNSSNSALLASAYGQGFSPSEEPATPDLVHLIRQKSGSAGVGQAWRTSPELPPV